MKRIMLPMLLTAMMIIAGAVILSSCKKEVVGPEGPAGADGADGLNGVNASDWCKTCHNAANWAAVNTQFASSLHASGSSWEGEGDRRDCAACHDKQGFFETLATGMDTTSYNHMVGNTSYTNYGTGQALDCDVCHTFHGTLDQADFPNYALRDVDPFAIRVNKNLTMNLGKSNLCAYCHQARAINTSSNMTPSYALDTLSTNMSDSVTISSSRFGGHNGPQAQIFGGVGYGCFEISGTQTYANSPHTTSLSCGDCHVLSTASGTAHGGHTFKVSDGTTDNVTSCVKCHTGLTDFNYNNRVTEIDGLLLAIENKMLAKGWLKSEGTNYYGGVSTGTICNNGNSVSSTNKLKVPEVIAAAIFNYKVVFIDGSSGVHNYKYTKALLTNTLAVLP